MFFFFKNKKITLDCFTVDPLVHKYASPRRSIDFIPDWWKDLPVEDKNRNMKSCKGFTSFFKNSFILPYWQSLYLTISDINERKYEWKNSKMPDPYDSQRPCIENHNPQQYAGYLDGNYQHIKLLSPWVFKSTRKIKYMWSDPIWTRQDPNLYTILPGTVDYTINTSTEVNLLFQYKSESYDIDIRPNTPLVMLTPLTEEKVDLKTHLVTEREFKALTPGDMYAGVYNQENTFRNFNIYKVKKELIEEKEKMDASKCPFGFGNKK